MGRWDRAGLLLVLGGEVPWGRDDALRGTRHVAVEVLPQRVRPHSFGDGGASASPPAVGLLGLREVIHGDVE